MRDEIRDRLLALHVQQMPGAIFGNLVNVLIMMIPFSGTVSHGLLLAMGTVISVLVFGLLGWMIRAAATDGRRAASLHDRAVATAIAISSAWAMVIGVLMQHATLPQVTILGMLAAGMMAASTITCATVPRAAIGFITPLFVAIFVSFAQRGGTDFWVLNALATSYVATLFYAVFSNYQTNHRKVQSQIELEEHSRSAAETAATIKLLLNDFEEQGSDWLWEVDARNCIVNASLRFAQAIDRPVEALNATPLHTLFASCEELTRIEQKLEAREAFRDVVLPVMVGDEERWWSLTGRPIEEPNGAAVFRGVATDISTTRRAEAQMTYLAHYDALTSLPNRVLFNELLTMALGRSKGRAPVALFSLDLDHFKSINDTLGHPIGDSLLREVGRRIESCLREKDVVARMGGDEFAVLITGVQDIDTIQNMAGRIVRVLADPVVIDGHQVLTSASLGIVIAPEDGTTVDELMKKVDLALYSAKANGRDRYAFFETGMDEAAQSRRLIEMELRHALTENQLSLYYQPLVDIDTRRTVGYEALVRWQHPTRGLIMPGEFVPIAEETGMIIQLGEWVIRNAIADAAQWPENLSVAINLSPLQMRSDGLVGTIINSLAAHHFDPARLELEITESMLMHETDANLATLHKLRSIGTRIALDDFGTGYSSLNYLRAFPFDKIKIDRCFVEQIDSNPDCQAIIRAVTGLASSLGMVTTAEGVEHKTQLDRLREEGCTQVQGFYFSKALPLIEMPDLQTKKPVKTAGTVVVPLLPAAAVATRSIRALAGEEEPEQRRQG